MKLIKKTIVFFTAKWGKFSWYLKNSQSRKRYRKRSSKYESLINNSTSRDFKVFLFLTPEYGNLGDHLIAKASLKFLRELFPENEIFECTMQHWLNDQYGLRKLVKKDDLIFITGGGFIGTLWPTNDLQVRSVLSAFCNNKIFILPHTFFCTNDSEKKKWEKNFKKIVMKCKDLHIYVREKNSYKYLKKLFPDNSIDIKTAPDMGLYLFSEYNKENAFKRNNTVGVCIRDDKESTETPEKIDALLRNIKGKYIMEAFSTELPSHVLNIDDREEALCKIINNIKGYKFVITNRLHGMIFCFLAGTPCLAYDNVSKKISGVHAWIAGSKSVVLLDKDRNFSPEMIDNNESDNDLDVAKQLSGAFVDMSKYILVCIKNNS